MFHKVNLSKIALENVVPEGDWFLRDINKGDLRNNKKLNKKNYRKAIKKSM